MLINSTKINMVTYIQLVLGCFIIICLCSLYLDTLPFYSNTHLSIIRTFLVSFSVILCIPCVIYTLLIIIFGIDRIREKKHLYEDDDDYQIHL